MLKKIFYGLISIIIILVVAYGGLLVYMEYFIPADRINRPLSFGKDMPVYTDPEQTKDFQYPTTGLAYQTAVVKKVDLKNNYVYVRFVESNFGLDIKEYGEIYKLKVKPKTYIYKTEVEGDKRIFLKNIPINAFVGVNDMNIDDEKQRDNLKYLFWLQNQQKDPGYK